MTLPNFLIIGEHKAGTTSLYAYLRQHPQVFMPALKEPRFFSFDARYHSDQTRKVSPIRTLDEYMKLFAPVTTETAIGEASPEYMPSEVAAVNIRATIPHAKLIVSLRNPIERVYSSYLMRARAHKVGSFADELDDFPDNRSHTYPNLCRYLNIFPREQIKIVLFDDMKSDTAKVVRELFAFLDVDPEFAPNLDPRNVGGIPKFKRFDAAIRAASKTLGRLGIQPPEPIRRAARMIRRSNMDKPPPMDPALRSKLADIFRDDISQLQVLLQRDLSHWLA